MPLFRCTSCNNVENTALANYWHAVKIEKKAALCSECDPAIGKWHGEFSKRSADGMLIDEGGHLWSQQEFDSGTLPSHFRMVGRVLLGGETESIGPLIPPQRPSRSHPGIGLAAGTQEPVGPKPNFVGLRPWSKKGAKKGKATKAPKAQA